LKKEGITAGVYQTGDVMYDANLFYRELLYKNRELERVKLKIELPEKFFLLTLHRAENTDDPERLRIIVETLNESGRRGVFPMHPRTKKALKQTGLTFSENIKCIEPVGYFEMLELEERCEFIVTDSGGVQKEAYFFKKPCITLRDETEWVETVEASANVLVGADKRKIAHALENGAKGTYDNLFGDGEAGRAMIQALLEYES
jgi:UDP-GlcNAc3NAcA epimerase